MKKHISLYVLSFLVFSSICFAGGDAVPTNALEKKTALTPLTQEIPECSICMLPLAEMKPIKKIPAFFVPMPCCSNKQSLCIECYTKVTECPFCRTNLEIDPQHTFRTMMRIIEDDLDQKTLSNNEKRIVHILASCDDVLRYFVLKLRGHGNPFSYKLSKDERSLLRAIAKKDADEREAERQRVEANRHELLSTLFLERLFERY